MLLPLGGPKGYGLGLIISLIVSAMAGGTQDKDLPRFWEEPNLQTSVGHFMGAIDISKFRPLDEFKKEVDEIITRIKSSRPAAGFKGVLIPGEIEYNLTQKNMAEGIELSDATLRDFKEIAEALAIDYPF